MTTLRRLGLSLFLAAASMAVGHTWSQGYPVRPVRMIVPFAPGGATDVIARVVSDRLSERIGQRVVVENRAGGAAIPGTEVVARAAADGYTLLLTANPHTVNAALQPKLPYDPLADFDPISLAGLQPLFLVLNPSVPAQTLAELVTELKAHPDRYYYSSSGTGGPQHLAGEMFKQMTGAPMTHVPFKGAAPAATELLSGRVQIAFGGATNVLPLVQAGRMRVLATSSSKRTALAPNIPTLRELGLQNFESVAWLGVLAPRGVSLEIVSRLAEEIRLVLNEEKTREKLFSQGIEAVGSSPGEFATFLKDDLTRWSKVIRESNIKPD